VRRVPDGLRGERPVYLELKAAKEIVDEDVAQVISYLKATGLRLGILLNFGGVSLQTRRIVL